MAHSALIEVDLVELELFLEPSPLLHPKHGHVVFLILVTSVFIRITWLFQDELRLGILR